MTRVDLTAEEEDIFRALSPDRRLARSAIQGEPWRVQYSHIASPLAALRFSEALVASLIEKGLIRVLQGSAAHAGYPACPFTVALSPDGEREHHRLMSQRPRP